MNNLLNSIESLGVFKRLGESIRRDSSPAVSGMTHMARIHAAALIARERPALFVAATNTKALAARDDLSTMLGAQSVGFFPAREVQLHSFRAQSGDQLLQRIRTLHALKRGTLKILVTSVEALMQRMAPPDAFSQAMFSVGLGDAHDPVKLVSALVMAGYERVLRAEGPGQCALRGGILDVCTADDIAYRIEFFGDEVDSIRFFDPSSQRSTENAQRAEIPPATEAPLTPDGFERGFERLKLLAESSGARYEEQTASLKKRFAYAGMENHLPLFYEEEFTLLDHLPKGTVLALDEPNGLLERARDIYTLFRADFEERLLEGVALPEQAYLLLNPDDLTNALSSRVTVQMTLLPQSSQIRSGEAFSAHTKEAVAYHGSMETLAGDIARGKKAGARMILLAGARALRLQSALTDEGENLPVLDELARDVLPGEALILHCGLSEGVEYAEGLVFLTESEIFGHMKSARPKPKSKSPSSRLDIFTDLAPGDYIVHESHGIGRFMSVEKLTVEDITKDYLCIQYASGDKLFVPADQMDRVQKYVGAGEERAPKLSKLGGVEWNRSLAKARASVKELAFDLSKLYAKRQSARKKPFAPDTAWQQQFEDRFQYEETLDQQKCISEIKDDLESERIMDRLLCGDVGYGKTEVALRAVFKAVMEGKQAAVLAPTTILVHQHYKTMLSRFEGFPITVGMLSRFRTPKEQKETLSQLQQGRLDVIVGTHRLLGKDVIYKDLGLLVVDEEHRFGVGHKEVIKNMKDGVNVLTLSATPIPRTLHMSLSGIRDMSVIETPPEERYPVKTYVMEYSDSLAREVILKETSRGGQVYFVYNNVRNMDSFAAGLRQLLPGVTIAAAHGQMNEGALERTMLEFHEGKFDVLLCSTIVESGLDIANVNTIIVYNADNFGLAQLYQLRGRVGRSTRLGYAYLTFRRDKMLTEIAQKRLMAIREFTEFGAGFKVAMRDLEIRGAGNLLGAQQHGHITDIGYDLYCKLMDETMAQIKGEERPADIETQVDIPLSAHLPYDYIEDESARIEMYKRIAMISSRDELMDATQELIDRFGDPPDEALNLMEVALYKSYAHAAMASQLVVRPSEATLRFHECASLDPERLMRLLSEYSGSVQLTATVPSSVILRHPFENVKQMLAYYEAFVHNLIDCISPAHGV